MKSTTTRPVASLQPALSSCAVSTAKLSALSSRQHCPAVQRTAKCRAVSTQPNDSPSSLPKPFAVNIMSTLPLQGEQQAASKQQPKAQQQSKTQSSRPRIADDRRSHECRPGRCHGTAQHSTADQGVLCCSCKRLSNDHRSRCNLSPALQLWRAPRVARHWGYH